MCAAESGGVCQLANGAADARDGNRNAAIVSYSIAGAALAGSLGFFLYGRKQDQRQAHELARASERGAGLSLAPMIGGGVGGAVLAGRF